MSESLTQESNGNVQATSPLRSITEDVSALRAMIVDQDGVRAVVSDFHDAVKGGTFSGRDSMKVAQGLAFLSAVIAQNKQHVDGLKAKLKTLEAKS